MTRRCFALILGLVASLAARAEPGPFARLAVLRPHDGKTVEFEAGYLRHLEWHRAAKDPWAWYGWSIWATGERYRWFVYATFGRTAAELDTPVAPADDERDNVLNVAPHVAWVENGLYEFLPALSRGSGVPQPAARTELATVVVKPGAGKAFEAALAAGQAAPGEETLWYRMVVGGNVPRYLRLRPRAGLASIIEARGEQALSKAAYQHVERMTVEVLMLRRNLSLGLTP